MVLQGLAGVLGDEGGQEPGHEAHEDAAQGGRQEGEQHPEVGVQGDRGQVILTHLWCYCGVSVVCLV